jgi:CheY-like chemotaxis protein
MHKPDRKKVLAAVDDLFFTVKIHAAAQRAGLDIEFVKTTHDLLEKAKEKPAVIVIDLNITGFRAVPAVSRLKADPETKSISVIGFLSHVQGQLKQEAQEAGADMVLVRSAFSQNLVQILKRHAGNL